jgi:hypothetical protein
VAAAKISLANIFKNEYTTLVWLGNNAGINNTKRLIQLLRWRFESAFVSYLIAIEDLADELVPEELQVFSNPQRRQKVFVLCFGKREKKPIMDTIFDLYESEVNKLMALYDIKPKSMRKYIEAMGKEKVIAAIRKEEMIAALGGKERLLKLLLADMSSEQRQKILAQFNRNGAAKKRNTKSRAN